MQSNAFKARIPAKVNLRLAVIGKRGGLHTLDMIVCPYDRLFDEVEFIPSKGGGKSAVTVDIRCAYTGFKPSRFKEFFLPKAQAIATYLGVSGRLILRKGIPLGAGLGGSSASVVGALRAMLAYKQSTEQSTALDNGFLLSLGSDVPCMFKGGICRVRGVGEEVEQLDVKFFPELTVRIAKGGSDTVECYALYDKLVQSEKLGRAVDFREEEKDFSALSEDALFDVISECRNDLTLPAVTLNPRIDKLIDKMKKKFDFVIMSGSGSAVVGFNAPR